MRNRYYLYRVEKLKLKIMPLLNTPIKTSRQIDFTIELVREITLGNINTIQEAYSLNEAYCSPVDSRTVSSIYTRAHFNHK